MKKGPYHIINSVTGRHIGPFTTDIDAALARSIGTEGWPNAKTLNKKEFDEYLESS